MLKRSFLLKVYEAASMQRWNDQVRTVELTELDKQAHKMIIAYVLGKCEEDNSNENLNWIEIIEAGIFEFLQRTVLTDLKPPLFHRIKENRQKYNQLNEWVYTEIEPVLMPVDKNFCERFRNYLFDTGRNLNRRIISASHFYATKWEFNIIKGANPTGHLIEEIKADLESKEGKYHDLQSMQRLLNNQQLIDFVSICAQLRFQLRWSHLHRAPKTSVLGHMLIVAMLTYLLSLEMGADSDLCINNYFTGLFHDLPEVLTRDVINPVKGSVEGLKELIKEYERQEMQRKIYKLIPLSWHQDMKMFTEKEFMDLTMKDDEVMRDGKLVKGVDELAAFVEAYLALENGIKSDAFKRARNGLKKKYKSKIISGINFGRIYREFN